MNSPAKKPFNTLDKAKSESMSDKDFEVLKNVWLLRHKLKLTPLWGSLELMAFI